jgi:hypothetical protein
MEIEELLAREEIRQLIAVYATAGDGGRREQFSSVFTEDAVLSAPGLHYEGRDNIVQGLFAGSRSSSSKRALPKFVRHNITTSNITFTGSGCASGRSYFVVVTDVGLDHSGVYTDEFRKVDGAWKIASREVRIDYCSPHTRFELESQA